MGAMLVDGITLTCSVGVLLAAMLFGKQESDPFFELNVPTGHDKHEANDELPVSELYFPIGQATQEVDPVLPLYVPVGQAKQEIDAIAALNVPVGQSKQEVDPAFELYVPTGQGKQAEPLR